MTDPLENDDRKLELPRRLAEDLAQLQHTPAVPAAVDMAIVASAKLRMQRQRRSRRIVRWAGGVVAAAAVVAAAIYTVPMAHRPAAMQRSQAAAQPTILDAFQLARRLQQGPVPDKRWDINHDGTIDRRDVDALASSAVRLKGERA